jgi:hydrogenase expression/formation protein HypC
MSLILYGLMCLAVPAEVLKIEGDVAEVDFGGVVRKANVSLVDAKVGGYVIVHAGYAIQTLDRKEAEETLDMFREILGDSHA